MHCDCMQINATITQTRDNSIILLADMLSLRGLFFIVLRAMFIIFGLKSIIKQLLDLVFGFFQGRINSHLTGGVQIFLGGALVHYEMYEI